MPDFSKSLSNEFSSDDACWQQTWDLHANWLRVVIAARVDGVSVDEVLQNVAVQAWKHQAQLADADKLGPWLYRIAIQQVSLFFRKSQRVRKHETQAEDWGEPSDPQQLEPLEWLTELELHETLRNSLRKLPDEDREILLLKHTEGWTYGQLSEHLGLSRDQVIYRLRRAQNRLRSKIDE